MSATPNKVNKIIVYEHYNFKGLSMEFISDIRDLRVHSFDDCISSLKVIGQPWILYEHPNFEGWLRDYEEGEYPNVESNDSYSSLRLITEDLKNPQITLYEHSNFQGKYQTFTQETNLYYGYFNDIVSSHSVERGAWILYEHTNGLGWRVLARAGEKLPDYGTIGFNDKASHIRPLKAGRSIVTSKVLWSQMKREDETCSMIDEIIGENRSDFEQQLTSTRSREYESSVTYHFTFSSTTTIEAGVEFKVEIIGSVSSKISTSFTVEKEKSETITQRDKVELTIPIKVPPHTKMTVRIMKKEYTVTVPVELTVEQNQKTTTEYGELRCERSSSIFYTSTSENI